MPFLDDFVKSQDYPPPLNPLPPREGNLAYHKIIFLNKSKMLRHSGRKRGIINNVIIKNYFRCYSIRELIFMQEQYRNY